MRLESQNRFSLSHLMQRWSPALTPCWRCFQTCRDLQTHEDGDAGNNMAAKKTLAVSQEAPKCKASHSKHGLFVKANRAFVWMHKPRHDGLHFLMAVLIRTFYFGKPFLFVTSSSCDTLLLNLYLLKVISCRDLLLIVECHPYPSFVSFYGKTTFSRHPPIFSNVNACLQTLQSAINIIHNR